MDRLVVRIQLEKMDMVQVGLVPVVEDHLFSDRETGPCLLVGGGEMDHVLGNVGIDVLQLHRTGCEGLDGQGKDRQIGYASFHND